MFVFDIEAKAPVWSKVLSCTSSEPEAWFPHVVAFGDGDRLLLVSNPGSICAYRASDGVDLGAISVEGKGREGFVIDEARKQVWVPGEEPVGHAFPSSWS